MGGTRSWTTDKIVTLDGRGPITQAVLISNNILLETLDTRIPNISALISVYFLDDIKLIALHSTNPYLLKHIKCKIPLPFLFKVFLEQSDIYLDKILLKINSAIANVYNIKQDYQGTPISPEHSKYFINVLWGASKSNCTL